MPQGLRRYVIAALLGLGQRRGTPIRAERPGRRDPVISSYEAPLPATDQLQFGRAYWLPPFGHGNGLDALFWTPLAELAGGTVDAVMRALREEDIPAWAAEARRHPAPLPAAGERPHDLWVAAAQYDAAQDVLARVLAA